MNFFDQTDKLLAGIADVKTVFLFLITAALALGAISTVIHYACMAMK